MTFEIENGALDKLQAENARLARRVKEQRNQLRGMNKTIARYEQMFNTVVRLDRLAAVEGSLKAVGVQVHSLGLQMNDLAPPALRKTWLSRLLHSGPALWGRRWTD